MKTNFFFALIFLFGISFKGISQTTAFNMDVNAGCGPLCINFSDQSTNALSWMWDFGDASAGSTVQFPTHCYVNPGVYTVTLTTTFASSTGSATGTVTVYPQPIAAFTFANVGNNTVDFTDQSTGAASWFWSFGDTTFSTMQNPSHMYASSNTDTVCLIAISSFGCSDTTCMAVLPTSIRNYEAKTEWNVFPNPSSNGIFTIQFDSPSPSAQTLTVENVLGEKILEQKIIDTTTIDLSSNAPGIYLIRLENGNSKKLLVE